MRVSPSPRFRLLTRCGFFAAAVALALPLVPWSWTALALPSSSPLVMIATGLGRRGLGVAALVGLPALAAVLWRRRILCRYVCPVGLINDQCGRLRRAGRVTYRRLPHIGRWLALLTVGAAACGYPLMACLDPFALFSGAISALHWPLVVASSGSAIGVIVIAGLSLIWPNLWCRRLCPLGATQDILFVTTRWRGGCQAEPRSDAAGLTRRDALAVGLGSVAALASAVPLRRRPAGVLRPPGAVGEDQFVSLCVRCGNCVRACPSGILTPDVGSGPIMGFLAPTVRFENDYCRPDCHRCTTVCPSGAIQQMSLAEKRRQVLGLAVLDASRCLMTLGQECGLCLDSCPYDALEEGEAGGVPSPIVHREKCVGCGACQAICVVGPRKAINVQPPSHDRP